MKAIRSHYLCRSTSWGLIMVLVMGLITPCLSVAWADGAAKTVLVFPVTNASENAPAAMADRASGVLTMALDGAREFDGMQFTSTAPSVRRAVSEGRIRQVDVQEGVKDLGTALSMGSALGADYIVLATIQSYTYTPSPAHAELILSGRMYEVASNINPTTGEPVAEPKVFRAFGVSGASSARAKFTGREDVLTQEALRDAADKAAQTLCGRTDLTQARAKKKTSSGYKWLLLGLIIAGAAMAIGGGSDDNGGGTTSPEAKPVTSLGMSQGADFIGLSWDVPDTTLEVLRYQIDRSVNGGAFQRLVRIAGTTGQTHYTYSDYDVSSGTYQYRIRVIYRNGDVSAYTLSGTLTVDFD